MTSIVWTKYNIKLGTGLPGQVTHGTHLVLEALEMIDTPLPNIYVAFFGGIIKCKYNFARLHSKVNMLVNYCSLEDEVVSLAHLVGHGSCGRWGVRCQNGTKAHSQRRGFEVAWTRPLVVNWHQNDIEHCGWFRSERYVENFFDLINSNFN